MNYNLPNVLTLIRIALIPVLVLIFYLPFGWVHWATTATFGLAALTDWLDGYLARRLGETSAFGAFLDPVADKLMVAAALVLLVDQVPIEGLHGGFIAVPAVIIIGREISISALREWMAEIGERALVAVSTIGKVKTTVQMIAILLLLFGEPIGPIPTAELGVAFLYLAAVLTLWSMFVYLKAAWPLLSAPNDKEN